MTNVVTPKNAVGDLVAMMQLRKPVMMLGQPGTGKSDLSRVAAREYLDTDDLVETGEGRNFIDFRASLIDPVDLHGMPMIDREKMVARWLPMSLLPNAGDAPEGVLLVDEITNGDKSIQGALYGLVLPPHRVGEYTLPNGWRVIAAGNRVEDRAAANRMSTALANRFTILELSASVDDWIADFAIPNGVKPEVIAFLRFRPELLNDFDPARQINATSRSWATAAQIIGAGFPAAREARLLTGTLGEGVAAEFLAFMQVWRNLPSPDTVLMDPDGAVVPDTSAGRFAISGALAARVRENSMDAFTCYLDRLPAEFGVMAMRDATKRDVTLSMTKAHIDWAAKNQDVYL